MPVLILKKSNVFVGLFTSAYLFVGSLPFAGIQAAVFLYWILNRRLNSALIRMAGIPALLAVFLIASFSTLTISPYLFSAWNTIKDATFFIAPVLLLVSGMAFMKNEIELMSAFKAAIYTLTVSSIILYSNFLFGGGIASASLETRYTYGLNSGASTMALLLIIALYPTRTSLLRNTDCALILLMNLFLILLSLSRADIAIMVSSLIFIYSGSKWIRILVIFGVLLLTIAPLMQITSLDEMRVALGGTGFLQKLVGSFDEFRVWNYFEMSDINENWRGYEAYLGIQEVEAVGGIARAIGVGFGSFVVGPFEDKLQIIPFTHNGFVTIYMKAGLLGLLAFTFFVFKLYRLAMSANHEGRRTSNPRMTRAALVIILMTNAVLIQTLSAHGVYYSKTTFHLFFIGMAICDLQIAKRDVRALG